MMSGTQDQTYYVRAPQAQDKAAWFDLWPDYSPESRPKPAALDVTWARLLDKTVPDMGGLLLFSVEKDVLVGFLHYILHRTTWYEGYDCYVQDVGIKQAHRYKGGFSVLYNELVCQMEARKDCHIIHWRTMLKNYPACAAYDKVAKRTDWVRYEHRLIEIEMDPEEDEENNE